MTTDVLVAEDDLFTIVQQVWTSFLGGGEADQNDLRIGACEQRPGVSLTGSVSISGRWRGSVLLTCSQDTAATAAGHMFMVDVDELGAEEIFDAMGELTNMVGGSIKAILPGPSRLSIPTVTSGINFDTRVPSAELLAYLGINWCDSPITVSIWRS